MNPARHVPLIKADLPDFNAVKGPFEELLANGRLTNFGKFNTEFERASGEFLGARALTTSSGTAALILTLQALGLKPGTRVILPSFTFVATAQAVLYAGGIPVFAEIEDDFTLSSSDLDQLLERHPDTSFVVPVHMYGLPCRTEEISAVVARHAARQGKKIHVIYDAAHAFGSARKGKRVGGFGDAEVFSLSVTKALTTAEGGMVTSKDDVLMEKIRTLRNYGLPPGTYNSVLPGLNSKMSEFHAVLGIENLKNLPRVLATRHEKAVYFKNEIARHTPLALVPQTEDVQHTYKDFTVILPSNAKEKRGALMDHLKQSGIETRAYFYPAVHEQDFFKRFADRHLPLTEDLSRRVISLPFYTSISKEDLDYMVQALKTGLERLT